MIVRQFLHWLRTAPPGERAEATSALARAYLYSDLSDSDRAAAEGAMIMLLDDPSPLVRQALAAVFAESQEAPPTIVHALASDQPDVASPLLERSPLFLDTDLVDAVATGDSARQVAVAGRPGLPPSVSAAIAEVGCAESCLVVLENPDAEGLVLRALLSGNLSLFEEAMAELTGMSIARVVGIVHDRRGFGFRALYERAGLPNSTYPIFREAIHAMQEEGFMSEVGDASRLKRRIIERVLTRCETAAIDDVEPLLTLLRRFEAEAAREEARMFCEDLVAYDAITEFAEDRQIAA